MEDDYNEKGEDDHKCAIIINAVLLLLEFDSIYNMLYAINSSPTLL